MYLYLYAPFLRAKKYAHDLALIEGRVTDFGISGKVSQLSQFLKFPAAVREFGLKKLTTLVIVGDDALFEDAVNEFALSQIVIGYIPMAESKYGLALAVPQGADAVDVLAARRIAKIGLGKVANRFFLGSLETEGSKIEIHSPTFSIFTKGRTKVSVRNFAGGKINSCDALEITVTPIVGTFFSRSVQPSVVYVESCRLKSDRSLPVRCGTAIKLKTPLQVDMMREAVRMVVGRSVGRKHSSNPKRSRTKSKK